MINKIVLAAAILGGSVFGGDSFTNIQPGYKLEEKCATARIEGGSQVNEKIKCYGFLNMDSSKDSFMPQRLPRIRRGCFD